MSEQTPIVVEGYPLRLDRDYHMPTHMWLLDVGEGRIRVGLDALTADTYGMLAQMILLPAGTDVAAGTPLGSLEAAKFVGPLVSPFAGTIVAVNSEVLEDPEIVMREPYDGGWLVELTPAPGVDVSETISGDAALAWYEAEVAQHREKGLVAE